MWLTLQFQNAFSKICEQRYTELMAENSELLSGIPLPPGTAAMFSPALLIGGLIFGSVGAYAFIHGWKTKAWRSLLIGSALSVYPWFVTNTILFYLLGIGLCVLLFKFRD